VFIYKQDRPLQDLGDGVSRRVLAHGGSRMAVEGSFEPGASGPMHHHVHEQLTYVLSGRFRFTIGDETHEVGAGDTLYKKPDIVHGCICLEKGVLLDTFTPQRQDFL